MGCLEPTHTGHAGERNRCPVRDDQRLPQSEKGEKETLRWNPVRSWCISLRAQGNRAFWGTMIVGILYSCSSRNAMLLQYVS